MSAGAPRPLPWPLRLIALIGRLILRLRRSLRRVLAMVARALERVARSPFVAAPFAALVACVVGLAAFALLVAGAWWGGVELPGPWQEALSITGSVWVMAHGVPVRLFGVDYSLIPWGLLIVPGWLGHQVGRWLVKVVRPNRLRRLIVTLVITVASSAALVAVVSVISDMPDVQTSARRALMAATLVALVAVASGMWRASELPSNAWARVPFVVRAVVRGSFVGLAALIGFASLVLLVAFIAAFGEIALLFSSLEPTIFDAVVLLVLSLGYAPTMIGWSLSYVGGAGFSLGTDVLVSPFMPSIPSTQLPAFPALAAIPEGSSPVSWALPALVVVAGAFIGLIVSRMAVREGPLMRLSIAAASAVLAAGWVYVLMLASTGALGDGRLATLGPDAGLAALLAGLGLTVGALPTSVLRAQRRTRRLRPLASTSTESQAQPPVSKGLV